MDDGGYQVIAEAVKSALENSFSQFSTMTADYFEDLCTDRDVPLRIDDLEYLEKVELLTPIARLAVPFNQEGTARRYLGYSLNTWALQGYLKEGRLQFLESGTFRPWDEYKDGFYDREIHLYHRYQLFQVLSVFNATRMVVTPQAISKEMSTKGLVEWRDHVLRALSQDRLNLMREIALLVRLETPYLPLYRNSFNRNIFDPDSFDKWKDWKDHAFSSKELLEKSGFTIAEIRNFRDTLAVWGDSSDPLSAWYMLVRIASWEKKHRLRGKAQLAQDLYEMTGLLNLFLKDLTGQEQPEPDDITDVSRGSWKSERYGSPFSYDDKRVRSRIVEEYLSVYPPKAVLFVEGFTEEEVITKLTHSRGYDLTEFGISLHNCHGYGGLRQVTDALSTWKKQDIKRFILLDDEEDNRTYLEELVNRGLIEKDAFKIWHTDFEHDNFGVEAVVNAVNLQLNSRGLPPVKLEEVHRELEGKSLVLMRAIRSVYWKRYHVSVFETLSKVELANKLIEPRLEEIETASGVYQPKLPIEKYLAAMYARLR